MDIYKQKSWLKILLLVIGLIIIVFTLFYTNYLSKRLAEKEKQGIEYYILALNSINNPDIKPDIQKDYDLELKILTNTKNPMIIDDGSNTLVGHNWGEDKDNNQEFLLKQIKDIQESGIAPIIPGYDSLQNDIPQYPRIYYKQSQLYTLITWFPLVQGLLIGIFILFGYMIFSSLRRAEQNIKRWRKQPVAVALGSVEVSEA